MARPKGADAESTRQRILQSACELLCDSSQAFSLRAVARNSGTSIGTVQYHFSDKKTLADACIDTVYETFSELAPTFAERFAEAKSSAEVLEYGVRLCFQHACKHRQYIRVLEAFVVKEGRLDVRRHNSTVEPLLASASQLLSASLPVSQEEVRLRLNSVIMLAARYAILSEEALGDIFSPPEGKTAQQSVEDHLVSTALVLLTPIGFAGEAD